MVESSLITSLFSAFFLGMLGSLHCVGMCGGIIGLLSLNQPNLSPFQQIKRHVLYNIGRIISYTFLGLLVAALWGSFQNLSPMVTLVTRVLAGIVVVLSGCYVAGWTNAIKQLEHLGKIIWKPLQPLSKSVLPIRFSYQCLFLGLIWGWLPCGLVYSALAFAALSDTAAQGALKMLFFGLGTLPAVLGTGLMAQKIYTVLQIPQVRQAFGSLIVFLGIWISLSPWVYLSH